MAGKDTLPKVEKSGGVNDIAALLQQLGPLFGSGKTTTKSEIDPESRAQGNQLLEQIYASISPGNLDMLENNVMQKAKQTFAPANIAPNAAGMRAYSDTTLRDMRSQAESRAAAEAMSARLNAINQAHSAAANLTAAKMSNTRSTQQQTSESKAGEVLKWLGPVAFAYNKLGVDKYMDKLDISSMTGGAENVPPGSTNEIIPGTGDTSFFVSPSSGDPSNIENAGIIQSLGGDDVAPPAQSMGDDAPLGSGNDNAPTVGDIPIDDSVVDVTDEAASSADYVGDFAFADGGVVKRPKPGADFAPESYTQDSLDYAIEKKKGPVVPHLEGQPAVRSTRNKSLLGSGGEDQTAGTEGSTHSQSTATLEAGTFNGSISNTAMAVAAANALTGNLPGAFFALARSAMMSDMFGNIGATLADGDPSSMGSTASGGITGPGALGLATGHADLEGNPGALTDPTMADDARGLASLSDQDLATATGTTPGMAQSFAPADFGEFGSGFGSVEGGTGGFGGGGSAGGTGAGSGDGSSDGGGYTDGDESIDAKDANDLQGVDKMHIRVTPGEAILPTDTVDILGEDFIHALIAATHVPARNRNRMRKAA